MALHSTSAPRKKALLVGVQLPGVSDADLKDSLAELGRLVDTLGYEVIGQISQKRPSLSGAVIVGEGKLREIAAWTGGSGEVGSLVKRKLAKAQERFAENRERDENLADDEDEDEDEDGGEAEAEEPPPPTERASVVVYDCELTPSQMRNLENATGATVLDRTGVIIEIFSRHARTRAARLQVEIARLSYLAPRLRETGGGGDRSGGGIGGKGAGETAIELDRRRIRDRVKELRTELEAVLAEQAGRRQRRAQENTVALVGYTNAGKSSLMRAMTGSDVYVADKLFATLETTVRPVWPETVPKILLSDTVGFIKKLPHDLIASFRSTLDEALSASLLLYVVDASDPSFRTQLETTQATLREVGVEDAPSILILNKQDLLEAEEKQSLAREFPDAVFISTRSRDDLSRLRDILVARFEEGMEDAILLVRFDAKGAMGEVRAKMRVLDEAYDASGAKLRVRGRPEAIAQVLKRYPEGVSRER